MKSKVGIFYIILLTLLFLSCHHNKKGQNLKDLHVVSVGVTSVTKGEIVQTIPIDYKVIALNSAQIFPDVAGKFLKFTVNMGSYVHKNQIIAYINPDTPGTTYLNSPVRSTISGYIQQRLVSVGQTVQTNTAIASVIDTNSLVASMEFPLNYAREVKKGDLTYFSPADKQQSIEKGYVSQLSSGIDSQYGRLVYANLSTQQRKWYYGDFGIAKVVLQEKKNILKIPVVALLDDYETHKYSVFVVDKDNIIHKVPVKVGIVDGISAEVSGIQEGQQVVIEGITEVSTGDHVKIVKQIPPLPITEKVIFDL